MNDLITNEKGWLNLEMLLSISIIACVLLFGYGKYQDNQHIEQVTSSLERKFGSGKVSIDNNYRSGNTLKYFVKEKDGTHVYAVNYSEGTITNMIDVTKNPHLLPEEDKTLPIFIFPFFSR